MRRFLIAFSFFVISVCLNQHIKAGDLFSGEWRMFVTSTGAEVPERDASIMLNIVKSGNFYNVQIKVPQAPQTAKKNRGGGYWDQFLQASQDQQTQFAIQLIRDRYLDLSRVSNSHL